MRSAVNSGNRITTDGLIFYLDVANSKSYISGSTTTTDIKSNIVSTLENGVGYDSDNLGYFVFDGVDDYIDIGNITTGNPLMLNGSELTLCVFVKTEPGGVRFQRFIDKSNGTGGQPGRNGYTFLVDIERLYYGVNRLNGWRTNSTTSIPYNQWNYVVITSSLTETKGYVNGIEESGSYYQGSHSTPPLADANMFIGNWDDVLSQHFKGKISICQIYNRVLSQSEILQNYNALKYRFE